MPYSVRDRVGGEFISSSLTRGDPSSLLTVSGKTWYEACYSYRTGANSASNMVPHPEDSYMPSGNIAERLAYRRKFIERQLTGVINGGRTTPSHFLLGDVGHEFAVAKTSLFATPSTASYWSGSSWIDLVNPLPRFSKAFTSPGVRSSVDMTSHSQINGVSLGAFGAGTAGYGLSDLQSTSTASSMLHSMNPLKKKASWAQAIVEIARGDVPHILGRLQSAFTLITRMKADGIKDAADAIGSAYLNNVFGWTPILQDINKAIEILSGIEQALYVSDDTRREREWVIREQGVSFTGRSSFMVGSPFHGSSGPVSNRYGTVQQSPSWGGNWSFATGPSAYELTSERITMRTSARFHTGLRPSAANNGMWDKGQELNKLMGTNFTIDLLWELTPWSWLIDWFFNIGSVLENLSSLGLTNTLLNYAYSTTRREARHLVVVNPQSVTSGTSIRVHSGASYTYVVDQKVRRVASPFGFGVSISALTQSQLAILVALGLARSR